MEAVSHLHRIFRLSSQANIEVEMGYRWVNIH